MRWAYSAPIARRLASARFAGRRAVVGFSAGLGAAEFARMRGLRVVQTLRDLRAAELAGLPVALATLAARPDPRVRYVEPVEPFALAHVRADPLTYENDPKTGVPYEWAFHALGVDQALNLSRGSPSILVGVVDSGVSDVPDLQGKVAKKLWDARTANSADDDSGHGTFVSSIIAAKNDDGSGLAGFCGACRLIVWKATPLNSVEIATGILTLTDSHVRVLNLSLVGQQPSNIVSDAINFALKSGVLVVAASGNDGGSSLSFPARLIQPGRGGLVVGASDERGKRASFSDYGSYLSLVAPGTYDGSCRDGIIGAIPSIAVSFDTGTGCDATLFDAQGNRYAYANGTSFAAPEVTGIAALAWAAHPSLTNVQLANLLEQTARRPAGAGWRAGIGWGVVDARAALEGVTGRSSADRLNLAGMRVRGRRIARGSVTATARAYWSDGSPVVAGARPACRTVVAGRALHVTTSLSSGVLGCTFTLPAASERATVRGSLSLRAPAARPALARFSFRIGGRK
jgi:hypothetical protein